MPGSGFPAGYNRSGFTPLIDPKGCGINPGYLTSILRDQRLIMLGWDRSC
jgi:hypothetical protein